MWLWVVLGIVLLLVVGTMSRRPRPSSALRGLRTHFPRIARLRLVATCPGLDGVLEEPELRLLFDWMLIELCRRTGSSNFDELMQWAVQKGDPELRSMTADVAREAVERLPTPVLAAIDNCQGRQIAAVLIDQSLTEAGQRIRPEPSRA